MKQASYTWLGFIFLAFSIPVVAQQNGGTDVDSSTAVVKPEAAPVTDERLKQLKVLLN